MTIGPASTLCKAESAASIHIFIARLQLNKVMIVAGMQGFAINPVLFVLFQSSQPCECDELAPIIHCLCDGASRTCIRRILARRNRVSRENARAVREPELSRMVGLLHGQ